MVGGLVFVVADKYAVNGVFGDASVHVFEKSISPARVTSVADSRWR